VLITDGENNAGAVNPETAAVAVAATGASLYVFGVGSAGEVPIDYTDPATGERRTGTFDSHFSQAALEAVAQAGNGVYEYAPSASLFAGAFKKLDQSEPALAVTVRRHVSTNLEGPFLAAVLIAACLARFVRVYLLGALL
jgi:Ca-activated chloride channel family protein